MTTILWFICVVIYASLVPSAAHLPELSHAELAVVGVNLYFPLERENFFNSTVKETEYGTQYVVSEKGSPDLPSWLRVVQDNPLRPAFIYGTPQSIQDSTDVAIIAIDRNTHTIAQHTKEIIVSKVSDQARYFVDLSIRNLNVGELFERELVNDILVRMRRLWPSSGNIYITKVATYNELGERLPVPSNPGARISKDGVKVQVGGSEDFSYLLKRVELEIKGRCSGTNPNPHVDINERFYPDFVIDWCRYRLITPSMYEAMNPMAPAPAPVVLAGQEFDTATAGIARRDFNLDFFFTIIFPIILAIALSILLSIFFFCLREGVAKRDEITPDTQMSQFNTIRRATTNLRLMSQRREGPPPLRTSTPASERWYRENLYRINTTSYQNELLRRQGPSFFRYHLDAIHSESGTLRPQPPPPYRLPPSYPTHDATATSGGVSPVRFDNEHTGENQRLVVRGSPVHAGNDNMAQQ